MSEVDVRNDASGALGDDLGVSRRDFDGLHPALEAARAEVVEDINLWEQGGEIPADKQPLDAAFIDWPASMLSAYHADRIQSELGRIIGTAKRLRDLVDRVVVLGIGGSSTGDGGGGPPPRRARSVTGPSVACGL